MIALLNNPLVVSTLLAGIGWLTNKIVGTKKQSTAAKVTATIATCAANMLQYGLTEPNKTPAEVLIAFKGIVAIEFAKAGITDAQRAPFEPLIRAAIAEAVAQWVKIHPDPASLTMPITKKLAVAA